MNYPFENDTSAVIKKLARKSVRFDKKKNLFCLSAIIVAVAMIMMSLLTVQNIIYQNQGRILVSDICRSPANLVLRTSVGFENPTYRLRAITA